VTRINASMTMTRLGLEADDLLMGIVTFRPDEDGDGWYCFCSDPPEPHVARGRTGKEAMVKLLKWIQARRVVYR
jgi:hypothetical protein